MRESFNQVEALLKTVENFLVRAGVPERSRTMPTGDILQIQPQKFIDAYDALDELITSDEHAEVVRVWALIPAGQWQAYDDYGITDNQEIRLLNAALVKFKSLWTELKPTGFFGKHYDEDYEEDNPEEVE